LIWLLPTTYLALAFLAKDKPQLDYSTAFLKLNYGRNDQAELEIVEQLEKCEDDYEGWMLLAEVYATRYGDLAVADKTIFDLCAQPNLASAQIAQAFHKLADWYLKYGNDPVSARRVLGEVTKRFPRGDLAKLAQERIDLLPDSKEKWVERTRPPAFAEGPEPPVILEYNPQMKAAEAFELGQRLIARLKREPDHIEDRETLARIMAEHCEQAEDGIDQLETLLSKPNASAKQRVTWLRLMASWEMKYRQNRVAARKCLERIIQEYPQTPQASSARNRLELMEAEEKMVKKTSGVDPLKSKSA
jgi:uncharacterized protein (DUF1499 family)